MSSISPPFVGRNSLFFACALISSAELHHLEHGNPPKVCARKPARPPFVAPRQAIRPSPAQHATAIRAMLKFL